MNQSNINQLGTLERRRSELSANLDHTLARIRAAEVAAGREVGSVNLVAVTKYFPASDVRLLAELGVTEVGENRHQEAAAKADECRDIDLSWHFIGGLQTNKAAAVARYADVVESVDRIKLVGPLSRGAVEAGRTVGVLLQVSLDLPDHAGERSGAAEADLEELAGAVIAAPGMELRGLMAVAPLGEKPARAFERLEHIRQRFLTYAPHALLLSAGMSGDLEAAVAIGATHVRVGSAILGSRTQGL